MVFVLSDAPDDGEHPDYGSSLRDDHNFSLLSDDDWAFVSEISDRFPDRVPSILDRFRFFDAMPAAWRPAQALIAFDEVPREGLLQRGYDGVESVKTHSKNMIEMFRASVEKGLFEATDNELRHAEQTIMVHDIGEVLTSDFTPKDKSRISEEEKIRLEDLSMKILFESRPSRYEAYSEYKKKGTITDQRIKVLDVVEWFADCVISDVPEDQINSEMLEGIFGTLSKYDQAANEIGWKPAEILWELSREPEAMRHWVRQFEDRDAARLALCREVIEISACAPDT